MAGALANPTLTVSTARFTARLLTGHQRAGAALRTTLHGDHGRRFGRRRRHPRHRGRARRRPLERHPRLAGSLGDAGTSAPGGDGGGRNRPAGRHRQGAVRRGLGAAPRRRAHRRRPGARARRGAGGGDERGRRGCPAGGLAGRDRRAALSVRRARPISVRCPPNRACASGCWRVTRRSPAIRPRSPPPPLMFGPRSACAGRSSTWSSRSPREIPPCLERTSSAASPSRRRC